MPIGAPCVPPRDLSSVFDAPPRGCSFLANSYGLQRGDSPRLLSLPSFESDRVKEVIMLAHTVNESFRLINTLC